MVGYILVLSTLTQSL